MRVLVCGGRNYNDYAKVRDTLMEIHDKTPISLIIEGGATGADELAYHFAKNHGIEHMEFPANWRRHGNAAGPIRNRNMLKYGKPELVVALPGGDGTQNMINQANKAWINVKEIK